MCSHLGIRQGYAIAYHHASNGRAEVSGSQIQKILRKLHASEGINWYEGLQRAVRMIHDLPGEGGLSPYEILYGRHRPYAGVPYQPPPKMEDAIAFFKRQDEVDHKIAAVLKELHAKRAEEVNKNRKELSILDVGAKVWWLRPRGQTGDKLESYWVGPCKICGRKSAHTYVIETRDGHFVDAHRSQLKEHKEDVFNDQPIALFHFKQAISDIEAGIQEWEVEAITRHKVENGELKFLVKWANHEDQTWEPVGHFFHRYSKEFVRYCANKDLNVDIIDYLHRHPISDDEDAAEIRQIVTNVDGKQISAEMEWTDPPVDHLLDTHDEIDMDSGTISTEIEISKCEDVQPQPNLTPMTHMTDFNPATSVTKVTNSVTPVANLTNLTEISGTRPISAFSSYFRKIFNQSGEKGKFRHGIRQRKV